MDTPELLLRIKIFEEYEERAIQLQISDLKDLLEKWPGVWWNAYSMTYNQLIKEFIYPAKNGFFVDMNSRNATHRFYSQTIIRRDQIPNEEIYMQIVPPQYRKYWFDNKDAIRCYSLLISEIKKLPKPIPIENFGLYKSWGKVSKTDRLQRPRLIKPTYKD